MVWFATSNMCRKKIEINFRGHSEPPRWEQIDNEEVPVFRKMTLRGLLQEWLQQDRDLVASSELHSEGYHCCLFFLHLYLPPFLLPLLISRT
jgi:hypothetical protein